ncbi:MAG: amidase [Parvibaculaceae bacterium]
MQVTGKPSPEALSRRSFLKSTSLLGLSAAVPTALGGGHEAHATQGTIMTLSDYSSKDATELALLVKRGEVTAKELAETALRAIAAVNGELNAVIETFPDRLENLSSENHPDGALRGVPMLNKDLESEANTKFEMGCELLRGNVATEDSVVVAGLRRAGLNNLGRTTCPEFGLASITESKIAGVTRNPWDISRTPGGSSGGSCAMVAAGAVPIATASDGGGSIRSPAAHCGLVGLKPTRNRVSPGLYPADPVAGLAVSFVVTRSVRDSALALDLTQGWKPGDAYGLQRPEQPYAAALAPPKKKLRVAFATTAWTGVTADKDAITGVEKAVRLLEQEGHAVEEARPSYDHPPFAKATLDIWCSGTTVALDALGAMMGRKPGPGTPQTTTFAFYEHGKTVTAGDLYRALEVFNALNQSVGAFFQTYDLFVTPTCMSAAPLIGAVRCDPPGPVDAAQWSEAMNAIDSFMAVFNTSGNPAISLPVHWSSSGLPVGVQFAARFADETTLFQVARLFETALPWHHRRPSVHVGKS